MTSYEIGKLMGSIFIAGLPTALVCFNIYNKKYKKKYLGILGAVGCFLMGLVGGLLLALPTLGIFWLIGKLFFSDSQEADTAKETNVYSIEQLMELKKKGAISTEEFEKKKKELMSA